AFLDRSYSHLQALGSFCGQGNASMTASIEPAAHGHSGPTDILRLEGISKSFGNLTVLDDVSLEIKEGAIHGVIGPNGAGKTTLFNIINGVLRANAGRIVFNGVEITKMSLSRIARSGIGRTFQVARVFEEMSVLENMLIATIPLRIPTPESKRKAMELLDLAQLGDLAHQPAIEISGGQKKLVELMGAFMGDPALILLDEPFNGISPALIDRLIEIVVMLNR